MANLQIRLDDDLRDKAQAVAAGMGLDLSSAVRMFLTQMVYENGMPFKPKSDPFYSEENVGHLKKVLSDLKAGKNVVKRNLISE